MADSVVNPIEFVDLRQYVELTHGRGFDLDPDEVGITEDVLLAHSEFIEGTADEVGITDEALLRFTAVNALETFYVSDRVDLVHSREFDLDPDLVGITDIAQVVTGTPPAALNNDTLAVYLGPVFVERVYAGVHQVWQR